MIKWLFFDLGSTLIDETECEEFRLQELLRQTNAPGREELVLTMQKFAFQNLPAYQETAKFFRLHTTPWPENLEKLYPNIPELLQHLQHKYRLGIIANQNKGTEDRLNRFGIQEYFMLIAASGELGISKPDQRIFKYALQHAACRPEEAIMIGDRLDNDIEPAAKLGMRTIWVKQGMGRYGNVRLLTNQPTHTVDNIQLLQSIV